MAGLRATLVVMARLAVRRLGGAVWERHPPERLLLERHPPEHHPPERPSGAPSGQHGGIGSDAAAAPGPQMSMPPPPPLRQPPLQRHKPMPPRTRVLLVRPLRAVC